MPAAEAWHACGVRLCVQRFGEHRAADRVEIAG
jgi:hypothetical protein